MGKSEDKNAMMYNIVDSVKGGCGKTTFSIELSLMLDNYYAESRNNDETSSLLIDMDIQGSALMYLLLGNSYLEKDNRENTFKFLNDRVITVGNQISDEYIHQFQFKTEREAPRFDVIYCDPRSKAKRKFRSVSNQNYSPEVLYSTHKMGLASMLLELKSQAPYLHKNIVFDMPPNSDGYSDAVYDVLLKNDDFILDKNDVCNLFLMTTTDKGHIQTTMDYFLEIVSSEYFQKLNKIILVHNDWLNFTRGATENGIWEDTAAYERNYLVKECSLAAEQQEKIIFVGLNFDSDYYRKCTQMDGIGNETIPLAIDSQIKYITNMAGDDIEATPEQLIKLIEKD